MAACPHCGTYRDARTDLQVAEASGPTQVSALAVAGFVLSLTVWWLILLGPLTALVLCIIGLRQANDPLANRTGRGFAIAGIIISVLEIVLFAFLVTLPLWTGESSTDADGTWHWSF